MLAKRQARETTHVELRRGPQRVRGVQSPQDSSQPHAPARLSPHTPCCPYEPGLVDGARRLHLLAGSRQQHVHHIRTAWHRRRTVREGDEHRGL